MTNNQKGTLN